MENEIQTIKTLENQTQTQRKKRYECSADPIAVTAVLNIEGAEGGRKLV